MVMGRQKSSKSLLLSACLFLQAVGAVAEYEDLHPSVTLESVQCRLEAERIVNIQYSTVLESYVRRSSFLDEFLTTVIDDDDYENQNPVIPVRVCWCAQYYNRRNEYCPEEFDACKVEGFDGPITCFTTQQGNTFIRGFWFLCVVWFLALTYSFSCTEQGYAARDFIRRKLCLQCTGDTTEEALLLRDIEVMIERDPDRATWLLRSAFLRDRHRQRIQEARAARRRGRGGTQPDDTSQARAATEESNVDTGLSEWQQKMELRVKKFKGTSATEESTGTSCTGNEEDNEAANEGNKDQNDDATSFSFANASQMLSNVLHMAGMDSGDTEVTCVICLSAIEVGDRIGDLECGHMFHVDCLKEWLAKKKNSCPLCLRTGLATPAREAAPAMASPSTSRETNSGDSNSPDPEQGLAPSQNRGGGGTGLLVSLPDSFFSRRRERS